VNRYQTKYPKAIQKLVKDRDALSAFYDFPAEHWVRLRTINPIESTFATVPGNGLTCSGSPSSPPARRKGARE
jgi:hypothetical protein